MNIRGMGTALLSAAMLLGAASIPANAGELYVGAGVGGATYESSDYVDCFGSCDNFKDSNTAWNIFVGYQLSDAVAAEIGYSDWGSLKDQAFDTGNNVKVQPDMVTISAVGTVPVADNISLFGRAGIAFLNVDATDTFDGGEGLVTESGSSSSQDLMLGFGADYRINQFRIRLEAQWIDAEDADKANYIGIAGIYGFNL